MKHYLTLFGIFTAFLTGMAPLWAQQEPMFSKYAFNSLIFNPAYAGSNEHLTTYLIHREQWIGLEGAPSTQSLTLHSPLRDERVGIGASLGHDKSGPSNIFNADFSYAYRFPIGETMKLALGMQAGFTNWRTDRSDLNLQNPTDVVFQSNINRWMPNFGAGIYLSSDKFYAGVGCPRLVEYDLKKSKNEETGIYARTYRHYYTTAGIIFPINDETVIFRPSILLKSTGLFSNFRSDARFKNIGAPTELDFDASFFFLKTLWVGLSYRTAVQLGKSSPDSIDLWAAWYLRNGVRIGVAYDFPINGILSVSPGSLELMAGYEFDVKVRQVVPPRYF
jgi:type IX secretion system PorP/SprF family membrane protein